MNIEWFLKEDIIVIEFFIYDGLFREFYWGMIFDVFFFVKFFCVSKFGFCILEIGVGIGGIILVIFEGIVFLG